MTQEKPFDKEMWAKCDGPTKQLVASILMASGKYTLAVPLVDQQEAFKRHDFMIQHIVGDWRVYVEVEQKRVWTKQHAWQGYPTLDVPYRKADSRADLFFMANKHLDTVACTQMPKVLKSKTYQKNTKHNSGRTYGEKFFAVDLKDITFLSIKDGVVRKISPQGKVLEVYDWKVNNGCK